MLADEVFAEFLGFGQIQEPANAFVACRIVDRNQTLPGQVSAVWPSSETCALRSDGWSTLPLLHSQRLVVGQIQPTHLTLSIEGIEVDMGYDTEGTRGRRGSQLGQVAVGELGPQAPGGAGRRQLAEAEGRRRHDGRCEQSQSIVIGFLGRR